MKKLVGVSLLSAMLILGQPFMAFADATGSKTINFEDLETIITEQNLEVQMNENERQKAYVDFSTLKRDIREIEDELDDINEERDQLSGTPATIYLGAEKRILLDTLKQLERTQVDRPTLEAMADLSTTIKNNSQIRLAEGKFIGYNQLELGSADISKTIDNLQNQLFTMQLQESLGLVSRNSMNDLETTLVDMQTKLQNTKFQQDSIERELKTMLNDPENTLVFESISSANEDFVIENKDADLEKALENSYSLKLLEQQVVIAQAALDRAKKDNGMSSKQYKKANYDLTNANIKLNLQKEATKTGYYTMVDNIAKVQSDLRLANQNLQDQKIKLSEAQLKLALGLISKMELDSITTNYQVKENAVKQKQIDLFNAKCNYEWFLKGMS